MPLTADGKAALLKELAKLDPGEPLVGHRRTLNPLLDALFDPANLKVDGFAERVKQATGEQPREGIVDPSEPAAAVGNRRVAVPFGRFWFVFYADGQGPQGTLGFDRVKVFRRAIRY